MHHREWLHAIIWFLLYDMAAGVVFRTPALLGAAIFTGLRNASALEITPALVVGYTILHFLAFVTFGVAAALILAMIGIDEEK